MAKIFFLKSSKLLNPSIKYLNFAWHQLFPCKDCEYAWSIFGGHDMFTLCNKSNPCPTMHAAPGGILTNTRDHQPHLQSAIITNPNPCIGTFIFRYIETSQYNTKTERLFRSLV